VVGKDFNREGRQEGVRDAKTALIKKALTKDSSN
jgi:hypothetical protein